jgi:hypothetical protein
LGQSFNSGVNPADHPSLARGAYASARVPTEARNAHAEARTPAVKQPTYMQIQDQFYNESQ